MLSSARWLLLIHQIPPKPGYFRAKVGRRLQRLGAVALKNSVYVLPLGEQTQEDLQWVAREIVSEGGDATLCSATFVEGLRDEQIEALFNTARDADYVQVAEEARQLAGDVPSRPVLDAERHTQWGADLARLKKRLGEIGAIDFFGASSRESARAAVDALEQRIQPKVDDAKGDGVVRVEDYIERTWVTRKNIHIDRIASAWLIRRFIDPKAHFKFVAPQGYAPSAGELTFDMFEADFTHVGDRCTFEVLIERFALKEPGLRALAEIVHDIDVKDGKFGRNEAAGMASLVAGLALIERDDDKRIELGSTIFNALCELYRRKRDRASGEPSEKS